MDELASLQESARQIALEAFRSTCYQEQPPTKWHSELTTMYFRSLLIFCLLTGTPLLAQEKATGVSRNEEPMSSFQAVNVSIDALLQEYEQLTGNVLIKDSSLAAKCLAHIDLCAKTGASQRARADNRICSVAEQLCAHSRTRAKDR
jgi:hypothetical protein